MSYGYNYGYHERLEYNRRGLYITKNRSFKKIESMDDKNPLAGEIFSKTMRLIKTYDENSKLNWDIYLNMVEDVQHGMIHDAVAYGDGKRKTSEYCYLEGMMDAAAYVGVDINMVQDYCFAERVLECLADVSEKVATSFDYISNYWEGKSKLVNIHKSEDGEGYIVERFLDCPFLDYENVSKDYRKDSFGYLTEGTHFMYINFNKKEIIENWHESKKRDPNGWYEFKKIPIK